MNTAPLNFHLEVDLAVLEDSINLYLPQYLPQWYIILRPNAIRVKSPNHPNNTRFV